MDDFWGDFYKNKITNTRSANERLIDSDLILYSSVMLCSIDSTIVYMIGGSVEGISEGILEGSIVGSLDGSTDGLTEGLIDGSPEDSIDGSPETIKTIGMGHLV